MEFKHTSVLLWETIDGLQVKPDGTYVDGIKIDPGEKVLLKNGARIRMGDEDFIFYLRKGE